ncbi:MAG: DUF4159 domain-containing protein [Phycisphaerae bacterium]|nr:DUF4159 domain-containing protein [Phycisphaerae bacterium]
MKRVLSLALVVSVMTGVTAWGQEAPAIQPPPPLLPEPLYKRVEVAIDKGVQAIKAAQLPDGSWGPYGEEAGGHYYRSGLTALALYALLEAGEPAQDPNIVKGLEWLSEAQKRETKHDPKVPNPTNPNWPRSYEVGLRCNVWYLANRQTNSKYAREMKSDGELLEKSTADGSFTYITNGNPMAGGDNSTSQLALLGIYMATSDGYELSDRYWALCMRHWVKTQRPDGGFGYTGTADSTGTMTSAGLASLFICYDKLFYKDFRNCNVEADFIAIEKSLKWLDDRYQAMLQGRAPTGSDVYYLLYGVERAGLASGYKYFGTTDWFNLGAEWLLRQQDPDTGVFRGGFGPVVSTGFGVLFLVRGRNSVVFNKLQFDSDGGGGRTDKTDWNCRPRDLAFLTGWINNVILETPINWQIVNLKTSVEDWHDAHILYIAGSKAPKFSKADKEKLKQFVLQGGTIFSVTECNGVRFAEGMKNLYKEIFPEYPMTKVDAGHPLYTIRRAANLRGDPALEWITNGIRPLVVHCDVDLAKSWQMNTTGTEVKNFHMGNNLFMYVTDARPKKRGHFIWPAELEKAPDGPAIEIGRVQWKGSWNPEPQSLERFARLMTTETRLNVQVLKDGVKAADAGKSKAKILVLSGIGELTLTTTEKNALKEYVTSGGTLVVDPAGGNDAFARSAGPVLDSIFGMGKIVPLTGSADIFNADAFQNGGGYIFYDKDGKATQDPKEYVYRRAANPITKLKIRPKTQDRLAAGPGTGGALMIDSMDPRFRHMKIGNRVGVYFSREDFTNAGLVGYQSHGVDGYDPQGNYESPPYLLMRNIVLVAVDKAAAQVPQPAAPVVPADAPAETETAAK